MWDRLFFALSGVALLVIGRFALTQQRFFSDKYDQTFDLGEHHRVVAIVILAFATAFFWLAYRRPKT